VFQHGGETGDYLLAHTLAMVAVGKGDPSSLWIASATLDRYLMTIGQKQIYGTQYRWSDERELWSQEPYAPALIPDSLRSAIGVPVRAAQQERLRGMNAELGAAGAAKR